MDLSELFISDFKILDNKILIIGNCIIQTDMNGNLEWYKKVKINFNHGYSVNSFQEIDKNIFCLGGEIGNSIFINKLNNSGDSIWNKPILTGNNIESSDIEKTNDLNFIFTTSDLSLPEFQTRILKVNPNGDIIWSVQPYLCRQYERGISIKQLDNNHYILLATIKNDNGYGSNKLMLYKIEK